VYLRAEPDAHGKWLKFEDVEQVLTHLRQQQAQQLRLFPVQDGPAIPWDVIAPFDKQCQRNHGGQTLEDIARRGGLGTTEAIAVLLGVDYFDYWDKEGRYKKADHAKHVVQLIEIVESRSGWKQRAEKAEAELATLRQQQAETQQERDAIRQQVEAKAQYFAKCGKQCAENIVVTDDVDRLPVRQFELAMLYQVVADEMRGALTACQRADPDQSAANAEAVGAAPPAPQSLERLLKQWEDRKYHSHQAEDLRDCFVDELREALAAPASQAQDLA
jgi:hypothetical protein